jgi:mono/diheme cytochrome c family protein
MRSLVITAALLALAVTLGAGQTRPAADDGREVFERVCAACHSLHPPAQAAPPISHAAAYYVQRHAGAEAAAAAMVAYLKQPDAARSLLPARALERFGLMPPVDYLSDEELLAVARYALSLPDTAHGRGGHQHRRRHGQGAGHRGGSR